MFLLSVAREMVTATALERDRNRPNVVLPDLSRVYPGTTVEPDQMRRVIDESFQYLNESRRQEIFEALHAALTDPRNAAVRSAMIDHFTERALMVRAAQRRLTELSEREKARMVQEFRIELAGLPAEDQAQLGELLRRGLLPVPTDLNQRLLAALEER